MTPQPALELDLASRSARIAGRVVEMPGRCFELLVLLAARPGEVVDQASLRHALWPGRRVSPNSLRMLVSALRQAIGAGAVENLVGRGYALRMPVLTAAPQASAWLPSDLLGREAALEQVHALLQTGALVTIAGPGGIGKTALANALSHHLQAGGRVCLRVDLAPLRRGADARALRDAIAEGCGVPAPPADGLAADRPLAMALHARATHGAVVCLDNAEHVVDTLVPVLLSLRGLVPAMAWLLTSQRPLHIGGETVFWLQALDLPAPGAADAEVASSSAVRLLVRRAQAVQARWQPSPGDTPCLAAIARALDGVPLALELAASRLPLLGARTLLDRIAAHLALVDEDDVPRAGTRHGTLRATVAWGYDGLDSPARAALRQLSVFAAPFRPDTAAAALDIDLPDRPALDRVLQQLVDHSLLQWEPAGAGEARLRMLQPVRWFARRALRDERADAPAAALERHGRAMAALAQRACQDLLISSDASWRARWLADHEDFMQAFDAAHERGDAEVAAAIIEVLVQGANVTGHSNPAVRRWKATRELAAAASPLARARLLGWGNHSGACADDRRAGAWARVEAWRALPAETGRAGLCAAWAMYAVVCGETGDPQAADQALAACEALEHPAWPARLRRRCSWLALCRLAMLRDDGDLRTRAQALSVRMAAELRSMGAERELTLVQEQQAMMLRLAGRPLAATEVLHDVTRAQRALQCVEDVGRSLGRQCAAWMEHLAAGTAADTEACLAHARAAAAEALDLVSAFPAALGYFVESVAELACRLGDDSATESAAIWLAAAERLRVQQHLMGDPFMPSARLRVRERLAQALAPGDWQRCEAQGRLLDVEELRKLCADWLARSGAPSTVRGPTAPSARTSRTTANH